MNFTSTRISLYTFDLRSHVIGLSLRHFFSSGGRLMSLTPDPNTIIIISRVSDEPDCSVCVNKAPKQICNPRQLRITESRNTSVEFTCPRPQDVFIVEINREIGMTIST